MSKEQLHKQISYAKSALRLTGYLMLPFVLIPGVGVLVVSEILGIAEEVYGA